MRILEAIPKEIHFLTEFSFVELSHLKTILDNMVFNYDSSILEHAEAKIYLESTLYPTIKEAIERLLKD